MKKIPVIAVVGPTASGKTALAVEIAKKFGGEVISADSMQIYEQMNIATAKPTAEEMQGVPHHLIGFQPISEKFSVADYVRLATKAVKTVSNAGELPIIAGGTGLYIDSFLDNIKFSEEESNTEIRKELTDLFLQKGAEHMLSELKKVDPETAEKLHPKDKSRIIRAMEIYKLTGKTMSEQKVCSRAEETPYNTLYIGINYRNRSVLYDRINGRVDKMLDAGLLKEAEMFCNMNSDTTACQAIGYKELAPYFSGEKNLDECVESLKAETRHYAKRQLTWFRKNGRINWLYPDDYTEINELYEQAFLLTEDFLRRL
ncbi:MAG: tRNA (adenosine(37)-N6)-dimethylallyltransferase MiaA [Oscillospiraceae bacterium]|nr:tRNA (adenosine(37)-N6)-dimethylallyltransferase MiaA [Oscillospiraceae bacterium]